ncbi:uncharacterized protein J8A68_002121 [[Candida] subhashii]|uniref:OPA3-like protein n=1 Tax=[Candida] subhashii TaxID=561895 RepID=A0A8J5V1E8_9ASCO|nr:uncharacterized protein J8A68_002121 [[Candida] subhashii]KAG7664339.1 hypothetical protein J8A68_002121 [[Candida] subhashii]
MSSIALKLTTLLVKTVAKPMANVIKQQAKEHERFRSICIKMAQSLHRNETRLRMSLLGEKKIKIRPLNDTKAIEQGATFISEFFIFSVAGSLIFYEAYRSRKKASTARESLADDISVLQSEIEYIKEKLGELNIKMDDYKIPDGYKPKYIKVESPKKEDPDSGKNKINEDSALSRPSLQPALVNNSTSVKPE